MTTAWFEAHDSKGACLNDGASIKELRENMVRRGEFDLMPEPEIATIWVTVDDLDPIELPAYMVEDFCARLHFACEWDDGKEAAHQDAKGKAQYYERKYGEA